MRFNRGMRLELQEASGQYPVLSVIGARQSGKTTLVKAVFPNKPYINLESIHVQSLIEQDPGGFLDRYPDGAIIDEVQRFPLLLSDIQARVDERGMKGMFILTGSHQVGLRGAIAQSLAGRTAILHLLPMSLLELSHANVDFGLDDILLKGCFPAIHHNGLSPQKTYHHYIQTYVERDVRNMVAVHDLLLFQKFIKLCAGRIGQTFSRENIANEVGVSGKTIGNWLSILEASYLIFLLPPYFDNFGKRAIKSPKLYFCDVGLAAALLGIENEEQIQRDPLRGALFENLVVLELMKSRWNQGLDHRLFFYRDSNGNEVDVLFQYGHQLVPIEIKSATAFHSSFRKGIEYFTSMVGDRALSPCIVYGGKDEQRVKGTHLLPYHYAHKALDVEGK